MVKPRCTQCGKIVKRCASEINRGKKNNTEGNIFCNNSCSAKYNNRRRKIVRENLLKKAKCLNCKEVFLYRESASSGKFCCIECHAEYRHKIAIKTKVFTIARLRTYLEETRPHKCESCGRRKWLGEDIPLQHHHKDGNPKNNTPKNVVRLCPNCHVLTDNWGHRNVKKKHRLSSTKRAAEKSAAKKR